MTKGRKIGQSIDEVMASLGHFTGQTQPSSLSNSGLTGELGIMTRQNQLHPAFFQRLQEPARLLRSQRYTAARALSKSSAPMTSRLFVAR